MELSFALSRRLRRDRKWAETWVDNSQTGNSGQTFGAVAAITAGGQNVTASVANSEQVKVTFNPTPMARSG